MAASLMGVNATIKSFPAALSLSTNTCKALSLSPSTCKALSHPLSLSLSSSSRVEQKKSSIYCAAAGLRNNWTTHQLAEQVNKLLDWLEKQTMEAEEMANNLRNEYEIIALKLLLGEDDEKVKEELYDLLDFKLELKMIWRKSSLHIYFAETHTENVNEMNDVLDWFEGNLIQVKDMNDKLRKEYENLTQKLFEEAEGEAEEGVLLADLEEMFSNLSEKQSKAIQAKAKEAKAMDKRAEVDKLFSPVFLF